MILSVTLHSLLFSWWAYSHSYQQQSWEIPSVPAGTSLLKLNCVPLGFCGDIGRVAAAPRHSALFVDVLSALSVLILSWKSAVIVHLLVRIVFIFTLNPVEMQDNLIVMQLALIRMGCPRWYLCPGACYRVIGLCVVCRSSQHRVPGNITLLQFRDRHSPFKHDRLMRLWFLGSIFGRAEGCGFFLAPIF